MQVLMSNLGVLVLVIVGASVIGSTQVPRASQGVVIRNSNDPDNPAAPGGGAAYYTGTLREPACSDASIDSAITAAVSGDIVRVATGCTGITLSTTIPSTKGILLDLNGGSYGGTITVAPHATTSSRITGCGLNVPASCLTATLTRSGSVGSPTLQVTGGSWTVAPWRVDHLTFSGSGDELIATGVSSGVFDHLTMSSLDWADEWAHNLGYGPADGAGWTNVVTPGSAECIYYEDSLFVTGSGETGNSWMQSYYGTRTCLRYNEFRYTRVDNHGGGGIGARWWEYYLNTFTQGGGVNTGGHPINQRAGSGIIYANTNSQTGFGGDPFADVGYGQESVGYPADYQIGRGINQTLAPAYHILNTQFDPAVQSCECNPEGANMVLFNRDLYTNESEGSPSCTAGGSCTAGVGTGTTLPTSCTTNTGFWKTDAGGNWDTTHGGANDGQLYKCTSTNTWTAYWKGYTYPHPLQTGLEPDK